MRYGGFNRYVVIRNPETGEVKMLDLRSFKLRLQYYGRAWTRGLKYAVLAFLTGSIGIAIREMGGSKALWVLFMYVLPLLIFNYGSYQIPGLIVKDLLEEGWELVINTNDRDEALQAAYQAHSDSDSGSESDSE